MSSYWQKHDELRHQWEDGIAKLNRTKIYTPEEMTDTINDYTVRIIIFTALGVVVGFIIGWFLK